MTESAFVTWLSNNWTWFLSLAFAAGTLYWRLRAIELDVQEIKKQQAADSAAIKAQRESDTKATEATYARRDVLAETLLSMNQQLAEIKVDLRDIKARHTP